MAFPFIDHLGGNPIIAAAKNDEGLARALESDCSTIFILYGDICSVADITGRVNAAGKSAFVHADLIDGLAPRDISVEFLQKTTHAAGIITTKPSLVRRAQEIGLCAIQRFFVIDSMALENLKRQLEHTCPDVIEILPGAMPKALRRITAFTRIPVIAGGLISDKEDILAALDAGAAAISSTDHDIWFL